MEVMRITVASSEMTRPKENIGDDKGSEEVLEDVMNNDEPIEKVKIRRVLQNDENL